MSTPAWPGLAYPGTTYPGVAITQANEGVGLLGWTFDIIYSTSAFASPDWSGVQVSWDMNEIGTFKGDYPRTGINADKIKDDTIVIAKYNGVEPFDGRFRLLAGQRDDIDEDTTQNWIGKSLLDVFRRTIIRPVGGRDEIKFATNVTPGAILNTLWNEAYARGAIQTIGWDFTPTLDSAGQPWDKLLNNISFKSGMKYIDVIRYLVDNGFIEIRMNGTMAQVFRVDTMTEDHTHDASVKPVVLTAGKDYEELPSKWSSENRVKYSVTFGDDGSYVEKTDGTIATGPFGIEEQALSQGGTKDTGMLTLVNDAAINRVKLAREQLTRKLIIRSTTPVPAIDFRVGDWITEFGPTDTLYETAAADYRVRTIVIDVDSAGTVSTAAITLNDKFLESAIRTARQIEGITGGVTSTNGSTTTPPTPITDTTTPNAPTSLGFASEVYQTTEGNSLALMLVSWVAPTLNTDGSVLTDFANYEINWKKNGATTWQTATVAGAFFAVSGLVPGAQYLVRVRALDTATPPHYSGWLGTTTGSLSPVLASDVTAPSTPATPTTASARGVITVGHDWKTSTATDLEPDTIAVEIHYSQTSGFVPSSATYHSSLLKPGQVTISGLVQNGNPWFIRAVAVDRSGNRSTTSAQASQVLNRIQGPDLLVNSIGGNELAFGSVTTDKIGLGVLRTNPIANPGFEDVIAALTNFTDAGQGDVNQWRKTTTTNALAYQGSKKARSGSYRGAFGTSPSGNTSDIAAFYTNTFLLQAGSTYRVSWSAISTGAGAIAAGGLYSVDAIFGTNMNNPAVSGTTQSMTGGGQIAAPYSAYGSIAADLYDTVTEELVIPPGQTDLYVTFRFQATANAADTLIYLDDVACIETGLGGANEITAAGMRLFDNQGNEVLAFMANRPNFFSIQAGEDTVGSWSDQGYLSATGVNVLSTGDDADGYPQGLKIYGEEYSDLDRARPWGVRAQVYKGDALYTITKIRTEYGIYELSWMHEPGRLYRVILSGGTVSGSVVGSVPATPLRCISRVRYTNDGSAPTITSLLGRSTSTSLDGTSATTLNPTIIQGNFIGTATVPTLVRLIYTLNASNAGASDYIDFSNQFGTSIHNPIEALVEDLGPDPINTFQATAGGGSLFTGGANSETPPAAPPPKTKVVKTYTSNGWATWRSKNAPLRGSSAGAGDTNNRVYQGYSSSGSYNGDQRGIWTFPSITGDVGTGTITRIRVFITFYHWFRDSGGTAFIKAHNYAVNGWPTGSAPSLTTVKTQSMSSKSGTMIVDVPSSLFAQFKAGTLKGFGIGPAGSTSTLYYGYAGSVAKMEVTYVK